MPKTLKIIINILLIIVSLVVSAFTSSLMLYVLFEILFYYDTNNEFFTHWQMALYILSNILVVCFVTYLFFIKKYVFIIVIATLTFFFTWHRYLIAHDLRYLRALSICDDAQRCDMVKEIEQEFEKR